MPNISVLIAAQIRAQNEVSFQKRKYTKRTEKSMAQDRPQNIPLSEIGKIEYERNVAFLSVFILLYLYGSDDGEVSSKEQRVFKKVFNKNKKSLNEDDFQELLKHTEKVLTKEFVLDYIKVKEYSDDLVKSAAALINKYALKDYSYKKTLNDLLDHNKEY